MRRRMPRCVARQRVSSHLNWGAFEVPILALWLRVSYSRCLNAQTSEKMRSHQLVRHLRMPERTICAGTDRHAGFGSGCPFSTTCVAPQRRQSPRETSKRVLTVRHIRPRSRLGWEVATARFSRLLAGSVQWWPNGNSSNGFKRSWKEFAKLLETQIGK